MEAVSHVEFEVRELIRRTGLDPARDTREIDRLVREAVADYDERSLHGGLPTLPNLESSARAAMKMCKPGDRLPWQRVIGKAGRTRGRIAIHDPVGAAMQRALLEKEGVEINERGGMPLDRFGWLPADVRGLGKRARRARRT